MAFFAGIIFYGIIVFRNTVKAEKVRDFLGLGCFLLFLLSFIIITVFFGEFNVDINKYSWVFIFYFVCLIMFIIFDVIQYKNLVRIYDKRDKKVWLKHYRNRPVILAVFIFFPAISILFFIAILNLLY